MTEDVRYEAGSPCSHCQGPTVALHGSSDRDDDYCESCGTAWRREACTGTVFDGETARECILRAAHTGECIRACGHRRLMDDGYHWCTMPFDHDGDHGDGVMAWLKHSRLSRAGIEAVLAGVLDVEHAVDHVADELAMTEPAPIIVSKARAEGLKRLVGEITTELCGARSSLGFACDLPRAHAGFHSASDPAYPAQPHAWGTVEYADVPAPSLGAWRSDCGGDYTLSGEHAGVFYFANYWPDNTVSASIYLEEDGDRVAGSGIVQRSSFDDCKRFAESWIRGAVADSHGARPKVYELAREARDAAQVALDAAHDLKRSLAAESPELDHLLIGIDQIQAGWAQLATAVTRLRSADL